MRKTLAASRLLYQSVDMPYRYKLNEDGHPKRPFRIVHVCEDGAMLIKRHATFKGALRWIKKADGRYI